MPIDSLCAGCGKTLRVNDEFVGRKARCPMCGLVYVVGGIDGQPPEQIVTQSVAQPFGANEIPLTPLDSTQIQTPVTKYFVRTPNTMVYGPSDTETVLDWIKQGRLDDTCHIREENSEQWLGLAAWRFQTRKMQNPMVSPVHPGANPFGSAPISTVQSAGYQKSGNGMVVLVLGLVSWILCPTVVGALVCAILAILFAMTELGKIRDSQSPSKEKILVLIGLWLGIANLVAWALLIVGIIIVAATTT